MYTHTYIYTYIQMNCGLFCSSPIAIIHILAGSTSQLFGCCHSLSTYYNCICVYVCLYVCVSANNRKSTWSSLIDLKLFGLSSKLEFSFFRLNWTTMGQTLTRSSASHYYNTYLLLQHVACNTKAGWEWNFVVVDECFVVLF